MEDGLLRTNGAQEPTQDRYTSLATIKFIGGLQTQRSPFASIDTRYNTKFLSGKPDALIAGSNVEISNSLTLQRRPGLIPYGVSNIPAPVFFFDWELATTNDIVLVIDTATSGGDNNAGPYGAVFNYSPTHSGIYVNKSAQSQQTNFIDVVNTLYMGDGVDLYKIVGPNLLTWSNTFGTGAGTSFSVQAPWTDANVFSLTGGQTDPLGGTAATQVVWGSTGSGAFLQQIVTPNYTPVVSNTFTFSAWMIETGGAETVTLEIADQSGSIATQVCVLTSSWVKYQVTGTMGAGSTEIKVLLTSPTTTNAMSIYGLQLEVGGPATTTQITTTKPQGVYLWGIQASITAPSFTTTQAVGNTGLPWQPNHAYNVGDTVVDENGNLEYATNNGIYPLRTLTLTSVASGTGVYSGTITGGAANALAGSWVVIAGFTNAANNVVVSITASTASNFTTTNSSSVNETHAATATLGVVGTPAGTSGSVEPTWNQSPGNFTFDGQSAVVQSITTNPPSGTTTASVTFGNPVQNGNAILVAVLSSHPQVISVTDTASDTFSSGLTLGHGGTNPGSSGETRNNAVSQGQFSLYLYYCSSSAGGPITVNVTGGGNSGTFIIAAEMANLGGNDSTSFNSNSTANGNSSSFTTGGITTANASDVIVTIGAFCPKSTLGTSVEIGNAPTGYTVISSTPPTAFVSGGGNTALLNMTMAYQIVKTTGFYNPQFTITNPNANSQNLGISGAFKTAAGTLQWINLGENGAGLTATIGYQWYYSYGNSYTGHFSNVSPISVSSGAITGQDVFVTGPTRPMTPPGAGPFTAAQWSQLNTSTNLWATDPQSDLVAVYRNTDGGGFFFQTGLFGNGQAAQTALLAAGFPGLTTTGVTYSGNTWTYEDITPDTSLNTEIYAPIGLLNSLPPAGLKNLEFFENRMWGSVANLNYFNTGPDNASILGVQQNGVPSESWIAINNDPFNSFITRSIAVGGGLLVFTRLDTWLTVGQNLLNGGFNSSKELAGHGLRSYNSAGYDGSSVYLYTSDRQFLCISPNAGSVEFGFPIGDFLEEDFSPLNAYVVRHVSGSRDNAVFLADGSSSWFRLNPNQQGASMSGEQTPVWSPEADFTDTIGGIGAIASIETAAGVTQFLVGQTAAQSGTGGSAPTIVQKNFANSGLATGGLPCSFVSNNTAGNQILVVSRMRPDGNIPTILDSAGNTYTPIIIADGIGIWQTTAQSGPNIVTVHYGFLPFDVDLYIYEFSNCAFVEGFTPVTGIGTPALLSQEGVTMFVTLDSNTPTWRMVLLFATSNSNGTLPLVFFAYTNITSRSDDITGNSPNWTPYVGAWSEVLLGPDLSINSGAPVLVRDLNIFSDVNVNYTWDATIGSILLATPGKIAEAESVTTEMNNSSATQCGVGVLLDEIEGVFESLPLSVNDPPQLNPSVSVLSNRFYLSQGTDTPICRHIQIQLSGQSATTKDEILALTVRGALEAEQS